MKHKYLWLTAALVSLLGLPVQGQIAEGQEKYLGNIYSTAQLPGFTDYWNQVTPENAGKWGSVERTRDVMDWSGLDAAYKLAKDNGFPFRMHVLIWGNQQPSWIENLPPEEQLEEIEEWFSLVTERYPDIDFLEVVNEPLHDPPSEAGSGGGNYIGALGGTGTTGRDWILNSFRLARKYFPNAALMINEYNIVGNASNTHKYRRIIELLQAEDLIDAIGVQGHAFSTTGESSVITANLNSLAETGLPIYVTEMDIDGPTDAVQLQEYQRIFPLFWEHPAVQGVTLWGWRPGMWRTNEKAYLVNENGAARPALEWLQAYVQGALTALNPEFFKELLLYPNPVTSGSFRLNGSERLSQVRVLDLSGQLLKEVNVQNSSSVEVRLEVAPGLYLVQLVSGETFSFRKILVK
ncbi:endo-1,4-beta-xylanase [Nafulsella turpanensis]|uniref:endo-1,4-beta-xylanase n=1 Tax=Nafulsella turpanensis TaxID=1265690 RepID=UPI00034A06CD|nr:endo-1,4-beta-xylanase [Nafulsella turpanensis]